ncbi:MAG: hypothetical protein ACRDU8_06505 [Egibacteraceae bacterium]
MESEHDPVARNRAAHPRRTPGRPQLGARATVALFWLTAAAIGLATAALVAVLISA